MNKRRMVCILEALLLPFSVPSHPDKRVVRAAVHVFFYEEIKEGCVYMRNEKQIIRRFF